MSDILYGYFIMAVLFYMYVNIFLFITNQFVVHYKPMLSVLFWSLLWPYTMFVTIKLKLTGG